jgi:hypothetical protein
MPESQQVFFELRLVIRILEELQHPAMTAPSKPKVQPFGGFFHQIKVRQPIGRKDFIQTVIRSTMY